MNEGETIASSPAPGVVTANATKSRDYLTVAGWGLVAYGIYNILIILFSGAGAPEVALQRMSQLVALFPVLLIGPALVHASQPSARLSKRLHHQLLRWLVMVNCVSYLAFIPVSIYSLYSNERANDNAITRLESTLQKRRKELIGALAKAATPQQIRSALSQFPEVSSVSISPGENPGQVRRDISNGIDQWIRSQLEQAQKQNTARKQYLNALVRTIALGCLVSGGAMLCLAVRMLPWLQQLGLSTLQTATQTSQTLMANLRRLVRMPRRLVRSNPVARVQKQKIGEQLRRWINRLIRRISKQLTNTLDQLRRSQRHLQRSLQSSARSAGRQLKRLTPSKRRRSSSRRSHKRSQKRR